MNNDADLHERLLKFQKNEITEHHIYARLAASTRSAENRKILENIAADELRHSRVWQKHTGEDIGPSRLKVLVYYWLSRLLGLTFGIKLMERGEAETQEMYELLNGVIEGAEHIIHDENEHEKALIGLLDEERLRYMGSIVLGLNDALVELTGGLAGLTLALRNTKLVALSGLIVGVAAALSMAASEYISTKTEKSKRNPLRSSVYTGLAYIATVLVLISPYLVFSNSFLSLAFTLAAAVLVIAAFNYYISVAKDESFGRQFGEMVIISLSVAFLSFGLGHVLRVFFGVEV